MNKFMQANRNRRLLIDGISLLNEIQSDSIATCFLDAEYRQVMDKMKYGNEGSRQKGRSALTQMPQEWKAITFWTRALDRSTQWQAALWLEGTFSAGI